MEFQNHAVDVFLYDKLIATLWAHTETPSSTAEWKTEFHSVHFQMHSGVTIYLDAVKAHGGLQCMYRGSGQPDGGELILC